MTAKSKVRGFLTAVLILLPILTGIKAFLESPSGLGLLRKWHSWAGGAPPPPVIEPDIWANVFVNLEKARSAAEDEIRRQRKRLEAGSLFPLEFQSVTDLYQEHRLLVNNMIDKVKAGVITGKSDPETLHLLQEELERISKKGPPQTRGFDSPAAKIAGSLLAEALGSLIQGSMGAETSRTIEERKLIINELDTCKWRHVDDVK